MAKRKLKLKKKVRITLVLVLVLFACFLFGLAYVDIQLSPVDDKATEEVELEIPKGVGTSGIASRLKEKGLIRNEIFFILYAKLTGETNLQANTYSLSKSMSVKEILALLNGKKVSTAGTFTMTFPEGKNMQSIAEIIAKNTSIKEEEFLAKMQDRTYLASWINRYWYLDNVILDDQIYYPLEGYLFPETYQFKKEATIDDIVKTFLDQTDKVLTPWKEAIAESGYSVHEIMTLASIVELEGANKEDRQGIAGVFANRLAAGWSLGSDVTTCYGAQVALSECNDDVDFNQDNPYNTRNPQMAGKLPIGPICNPSSESIDSVLHPTSSDYYYFVADKYKKIYFSKTDSEHQTVIAEIKERGDWPW